jgi:N-dimethylarginine dimethylaminohydrolase
MLGGSSAGVSRRACGGRDPRLATKRGGRRVDEQARSLDNFDVTTYPDYRKGLPPDVYELLQFSHLDEQEKVWGRQWGAQGIGKLREVGLVAPSDHEAHPLWAQDPNFFLLRYRSQIDIETLIQNHKQWAELLEENGVSIHWMEYEDFWGAYGPMRKLFVCEEVKFIRGGAIIPRFGHASYKRGMEREFQKFVARIGCPILYSVHGTGIMEVGPMLVGLTDDVWVAGLSCGANREGVEQVMPVLHRSGIKEVHVMELPTILDTFDAGGEFHVDMVISPVDFKKVIVYPDNLPWETYVWLRDREFEVIEIPQEDQRYCPANLIVLEPGKVIMPKRAVKTIEKVRDAGVEVIEFDSDGIMQGGVNGLKCITLEILRDSGPLLYE